MAFVARVVRSLALTALLLAPVSAAAEEKSERPHPLARIVHRARAGQLQLAMLRMISMVSAQASFQGAAFNDVDQDGIGEFAVFQELSALVPPRTSADGTQHRKMNEPSADLPEVGGVDEGGRFVDGGYVFQVFLPGADGRAQTESTGRNLAEGALVDSDLAEKHWCCYAWPESYGKWGRLTLFVNERGDVLATDSKEYSGREHGPDAGAAFSGGGADVITGKPAADTTGQDGNRWRPVQELRNAAISIAVADSPWRNREVLQKRLSQACDVVETLKGKPFPKGAPTVAVTQFDHLVGILRAELGPLVDVVSAPGLSPEAALELAAASAVAKYEQATNTIHVIPLTVDAIAAFGVSSDFHTEEALGLILVHEAVHAMDFQEHALLANLRQRGTQEELMSWGAAVEGHAQLVTERHAREIGQEALFRRLTEAVTWTGKTGDPLVDQFAATLSATAAFPYVQGHAFAKAVSKAAGAAGLRRMLEHPPTTTREVERPGIWLDPSSANDSVPIDDVLAAFDGLPPEGWKRTVAPVIRAALRAQMEPFGDETIRETLAHYDGGKALVAADEATGRMIVVGIMQFDTPVYARAMVAFNRKLLAKRLLDAKKSAAVEVVKTVQKEGAGSRRALHGFTVEQILRIGGRDVHVRTQSAVAGAFVIELTVQGRETVGQEAQDAAVSRAAARIDKPR